MKDNWQKGFGQDATGNTIWQTTASTGGGTATVKDLDFGLQQVIDPVTGFFRVLVSS